MSKKYKSSTFSKPRGLPRGLALLFYSYELILREKKVLDKIFHGQKFGQGLIEVVVALGAAAVIVTAITVSVLTSLNNALFSKTQNLATQFAREGIEVMRNIRDSDYQGFVHLASTNYCLGPGATKATDLTEKPALPPYCGLNVGTPNPIFSREVTIALNSALCAQPTAAGGGPPPAPSTKVDVIVSWSDGKCSTRADLLCHKVKVSSCFSESPFFVPTPK